MASKIDELLEEAETGHDGDTSINYAEREFGSEQEARSVYDKVKQELVDIRFWKEHSTPSSYELFDESGNIASGRPIDKGDFIRVSVYGSGKHDWVRVTNIYETPVEFVITVSPTYDPTADPVDPTVISHFFIPDSTNNFCLRHRGDRVGMYVIGLNEKQNTSYTGGILETARNVGVSNIGYYLGLQKGVWTEFCTRFLAGEGEETLKS